jgi:uracil-DNA glycosylase
VLALTGKNLPITRARGPAYFGDAFQGYVTVHPSYLLRIRDEPDKTQAYAAFVEDLRKIRDLARKGGPARRPMAAE